MTDRYTFPPLLSPPVRGPQCLRREVPRGAIGGIRVRDVSNMALLSHIPYSRAFAVSMRGRPSPT